MHARVAWEGEGRKREAWRVKRVDVYLLLSLHASFFSHSKKEIFSSPSCVVVVVSRVFGLHVFLCLFFLNFFFFIFTYEGQGKKDEWVNYNTRTAVLFVPSPPPLSLSNLSQCVHLALLMCVTAYCTSDVAVAVTAWSRPLCTLCFRLVFDFLY